jgi:hypothetical protein
MPFLGHMVKKKIPNKRVTISRPVMSSNLNCNSLLARISIFLICNHDYHKVIQHSVGIFLNCNPCGSTQIVVSTICAINNFSVPTYG